MKTTINIMIVTVLLSVGGVCFAEENKDDNVEKIINGNTEFAFDLYAQLKSEEGNLFLSPYSISTALAMTYTGARGETAEQMSYVLNFLMHPKELNPKFGQLIDQLNKQGQKGDYQLSIANSLWGQKLSLIHI